MLKRRRNEPTRSPCPSCSWPLEQHTRDLRLLRPDEIADWSDHDLSDRVDTNDIFMRVDGDRYYIRSILPVHLSGGHLIAFAVWVQVTVDDLTVAAPTWDTPDYADLRLSGYLANTLPPFPDLEIGAPVETEVKHLDELPYVSGSSNPLLTQILETDWDHATVLDPLPNGR